MFEPAPIDEGTAVVLVDHGSRFDPANRMLEDAARQFQKATGVDIVEHAHMELAEPTIEQAIGRCVERGAKKVVVTLFFLSPGRHSISDIPRMVMEAAAMHPGVPCAVSEPIGLHPALHVVLADRVNQACDLR